MITRKEIGMAAGAAGTAIGAGIGAIRTKQRRDASLVGKAKKIIKGTK